MLNDLQFGFRKHHSTETAVCYFLETVKSKLDTGGVVGAVFLDLSKVFDTVNHKLLTTKLTHLNFSEKSLKWMESYLSSRLQCVRVQNMKFMPCEITQEYSKVQFQDLFYSAYSSMTWHIAVHQQSPANCMLMML